MHLNGLNSTSESPGLLQLSVREKKWGVSKSPVIKPFQPCFIQFDIFSFSAQQTIIDEMNVVWQRLIVGREVGSIVFKELPLHPIFVLLFLPPDRKHDDE